MGVRDRLMAGLAQQLGRPEGLRGRFVARGLNRRNHDTVAAAVEAARLAPGQTGADIGFGGGVGLPLLLAQVHPGGHVHGVDLSDTMLDQARRSYRQDVSAGTLSLHAGSITALPLTDTSLDAAITVNTIYFVADLARAFTELARVLRPAGRVVVGLAEPREMARMPFTAHGFTIRPVDDVASALVAAGFAAVSRLRVGDGEDAYHLLVAVKPSST